MNSLEVTVLLCYNPIQTVRKEAITMKTWLREHKHGWVLSYLFFYLIWFFLLENRPNVTYHPIQIGLDEHIPFQEIFIIPYLLWFIYIAGTVLFFFFISREDFYKTTAFLFTGMTICLVIYTFWPNCQNLRPATFPRSNIWTRIVAGLYQADTSTNVCPSIHVFNSIGAHIAIHKSQTLQRVRWVRPASFLLMISICLSTVFLKQHSVFDGLCAILLATIMYAFVYIPDYHHIHAHKIAHKHQKQLS